MGGWANAMRERKKEKKNQEEEFGNLGLCNGRKNERKENRKMNLEKARLGASAIIVYYIQLKAGQMQC